MKRRDFFTTASSLLLPVMVDGFGVKSLAQNSSLVQSLAKFQTANDDRILVIIYLGGGNDGLNTVIPLDQYTNYYGLRKNISIPESQVLRLAANPETGLHPAMTGMRELYDEGKLAIIHSASYPNPDQSHYRSTDIWMTGVDSTQVESTGWAGRYLNDRFENYPQNYPNYQMEDPLAIQIGYVGTTALLGGHQSMQITISDPTAFYQMIGTQTILPGNDLPCCDAGDLLTYAKQQQVLSVGYASEIKQAADTGKNLATYPTGNGLADQLRIVSRLIHGGLKTKIYYVEMGGFDTHAEQVSTSTTSGTHANLLRILSDGVTAFQKDLKLQGIDDKVMGMTFSDFGRRATSNSSKGTDHGIAAPMFVFGTGMKRQMVGNNPDLTNGLISYSSINKDIKMQIDFRRVYSDILNDWFGTAPSKTNELLFRNFQTTSLFSDTVQTLASGAWPNPEIWSNGRVPSSKDIVKVNIGHVIEVGQNIVAKKVQVDGELKFLGDYTVSTTG